MEVIYYQLFFVLSTVITWRTKGVYWGSGVATLWTLWTLIVVKNPALMAVQLGFLWGAVIINAHFQNTAKKVYSLKRELDHLSKAESELVENAHLEDKLQIIRGREHEKILEQAFEDCEQRLCIISGWIGDVISDKFGDKMSRLLDRGCDIYIGFGYENRGVHELGSNGKRALQVLCRVQKAAQSKGKGLLKIVEYNTHEKILIVEGKYLIVGSNNWLTNRYFNNEETSAKISNPIEANLQMIELIERFNRLEQTSKSAS